LSLAGNRAGLSGRESGAFWPFIEILGKMREQGRSPRIVMIENVPGFLTSGAGSDFRSAVEALNHLGYRCDAVLLNALHFVPQSRQRLFVIGLQDDTPGNPMRLLRVLESESPLRPEPLCRFINDNSDLLWGRIDLPSPPNRRPSLTSILEEVSPEDPRWWKADRVKKLLDSMQPIHRRRVEQLSSGKRPRIGTVYRRTRRGKAVAEVRTDNIAGCLRTARGGSSKQFLIIGRDGEVAVRNLTPREYARLQGAPDFFQIGDDANLGLSSFGDAVCVPAVHWLVENAFSSVNKIAASNGERSGLPVTAPTSA
jgi:DNA (cytosine-5)-methyltransferase 1